MLLLVVFSALAQAQVVVTDDANTSSSFPTTNFGSSIALIVCSGSNTYIKFSTANLGSGLTGSNVSKATLTLYVDAVLTSGTMDVYQVNGSWSEGKITYNSAPALGTKLFSAVSVNKTGYLSLDVTPTLQAWLNGTLANNGIALVPTSGSGISVSFDSKENIFTSHTAQLNLVLLSAGPQGIQGPIGPQGPTGLPPANVAITTLANNFTTGQTISGSLAISGTGNGIKFPDGTTQTTASANSGTAANSRGTASAFLPGALNTPLHRRCLHARFRYNDYPRYGATQDRADPSCVPAVLRVGNTTAAQDLIVASAQNTIDSGAMSLPLSAMEQ